MLSLCHSDLCVVLHFLLAFWLLLVLALWLVNVSGLYVGFAWQFCVVLQSTGGGISVYIH